jgi:undecaprenyl-diphosphatase
MSPTVLCGYIIALCATMPWPRSARVAGAIACAVILALTGIVNIWLGVHWLTDVIGGYLWGGALVLAGLLLSRAIARRLTADT